MPEKSVLDPEIHGRLLDDRVNILNDANIQEEWLHKTTVGFLHPSVQQYGMRFKLHRAEGTYGLIAFGKVMPQPMDHMSSIAGLLTRNFIRCRVVTLDTFIEGDDEDLLTMSCVCIPNFFVGLPLAEWKLSGLMDRLLQRKLNGKQTVVWASDENSLSLKYGSELVNNLTRDFIKVRP